MTQDALIAQSNIVTEIIETFVQLRFSFHVRFL